MGAFPWTIAIWAVAWAAAITALVFVNKYLKKKDEEKKIKAA